MQGVWTRPQALGDGPGASELDERLALAAAGGDDAAFARLYERYAARLHGYCWTILRDDGNAQDALQSTWLKALVALREGRRAAPVRPWLFRIAHNESISVLRGLRPESGALGLGPAAPSAEEQALRRERLHQVVADLQALPERTRGALVLRELCGLTHEEIALTLQTTVGGAKQSILDARQELREYDVGRDTACAAIRGKISAGDRRVLRARSMRAHLRHCPGCAGFAAAAGERRGRLAALIPPLAPLVAERVLRGVLAAGGRAGTAPASTTAGAGGAGSATGTAGTAATGGGAVAAGGGAVAGTGKAMGTAILAKLVAGAAAAGGLAAVGGIAVIGHRASRPPRTTPAVQTRAAAVPAPVGRSGSQDSGTPPARHRADQSAAGDGRRRPAASRKAPAPRRRTRRDARRAHGAPGRRLGKRGTTHAAPATPRGHAKRNGPTIRVPPGQAKRAASAPPGHVKRAARTAASAPPRHAKRHAFHGPQPAHRAPGHSRGSGPAHRHSRK